MRYRNPKSGVDIDLGTLDTNRKRLFDTARERFKANASWSEFAQFFTSGSPLYEGVSDRAEVLNDPLFNALKDMWLQLGIRPDDAGAFAANGGPGGRTSLAAA